ncbi:hypothetical protein MSAN_02233100 [Mycena sanguinolenta]|uniref:Uncharacterized protein n=1 Tax=Mycena sanguinolenta TaxID=230812 RepID=A0A8H6XAQ8_9AGAR|nr:hypothetical protein MSAN_02233100 [Mycena sanguinolenta]
MFTRSDSPSTPLFLNSSQTSKKRRRECLDCPELPASSGKPKVPRRIDPDRLAIRLGPELVSEMDAYIVPGAKMPSFEVGARRFPSPSLQRIRQDLVKRYGVDRRHIYDYLHSRGLRVAKEDKHLNLSHRMSRKPAASSQRAAVSKPAASKVVSSDPVKPVESAIFDSPPPETNPISPPTVMVKSTEISMDPAATNPSEIISIPSPDGSSQINEMRVEEQDHRIFSPGSRFSQPIPCNRWLYLPDSSDSEDGSPLFDFTDTLTDSSSFDEDLNLLSLGHSVSNDKLRELFGSDFIPFAPASPDDLLYELDEFQRDMPICDSLLPLDGPSHLSGNDRMEFYNLVNAGIGPARGIEECAGTYKAHMERLYYNRSYSGPQPRSRCHDDPYYSTTPEIIHTTHPPSIIEKENVNPQLSTSHAAINSQPYYRQFAIPPSPLHRRVSNYAPLSPRREHPAVPSVSANTSHPKPFVLHPSVSNQEKITSLATPPADPRPQESPTPLIWMSPIKYSASASSQRTQSWQAQMSQVISRSDPFAVPTFYTPSGHIIHH